MFNHKKFNVMRNLLIAILFLTACTLQAQRHQTIFGDLNVVGAFGSPIVEISSINGESISDVGGGGALILEDFFIGWYGLGNDLAKVSVSQELYDIRFKHNGFWLGYVPKSYKVAHLYGSARIGWGRTDLRQGKQTFYSDRVFVMTPELGVEFNVFDFFKLAVTGGYRWVNGVDRLPSELDNKSFSSPVGTFTFRLGGF